jgi:hypothetical protein
MIRLKLIFIIIFITGTKSFSQKNGELYDTISKLDSLFFKALNNCDLKKYESFLAFDYEFYHDKQGLTTSKKNEMESMNVFCGEQRDRQQIKRKLLKGSLEVYPLNNYGAIEIGEHIFYLVIDDKTSKPISKAKFTSVWRFDNNQWKLARTLSYNHIPYGMIQLDSKTLNIFEGKYIAEKNRIINVKREGQVLKMNEDDWTGELLAETENTFYLSQNNVQVKFIIEQNKVVKLIVYENGKFLEEAIREK